MSNGSTAKMRCWKPQGIPLDEPERKMYRTLIVEAIYSVWHNRHEPAGLAEIYWIVKQKIQNKINDDTWPYKHYRSKRTVDRRVNEAASGKNPKIIAVTAGIYMPNPKLIQIKT